MAVLMDGTNKLPTTTDAQLLISHRIPTRTAAESMLLYFGVDCSCNAGRKVVHVVEPLLPFYVEADVVRVDNLTTACSQV